MRYNSLRVLILSVFCLLAYSLQAETVNVPAKCSFTKQGFEYTKDLLKDSGSIKIYQIRYPSPVVTRYPANNLVPGELYIPKGIQPGTPAVVVLHILEGDFTLERLICTSLASSGVVAMFIKMPFYDERGADFTERHYAMVKYSDLFILALEQSRPDIRRALDILSSVPSVDSFKLGVTGTSMGALLSASVCGVDSRIQRALLFLGGGNLKSIIQHKSTETELIRQMIDRLSAEKKKEFWEKISKVDPLNQQTGLQRLAKSGHLKMINANQDQVIPPACSIELAKAANCRDIRWLNGKNHYTAIIEAPLLLDELTSFFAADVPKGWKKHQQNISNDWKYIGNLAGGLSAILDDSHEIKKACVIGGELSVSVPGTQELHAGKFEIVRCPEMQWCFLVSQEKLGSMTVGRQGNVLFANQGNFILAGNQDVPEVFRWKELFPENQQMNLELFFSILKTLSIYPQILEQYFILSSSRTGQSPAVQTVLTLKRPDDNFNGTLIFDSEGTPQSAEISYSNLISVKLTFSKWGMNNSPDEYLPILGKKATVINTTHEGITSLLSLVIQEVLLHSNIPQ